MRNHGTSSKHAHSKPDEIKWKGMAVQIIDKPPSCCMAIHPLKELNDFIISQMVRKNRADNEIGGAVRIYRKDIASFKLNGRGRRSKTFGPLFSTKV